MRFKFFLRLDLRIQSTQKENTHSTGNARSSDRAGNNHMPKWIQQKGYQKKILLDKIPGRIQSIQINKFKAGAIVPAHYHKKTYEIFYILSGNAIINIGKKEYKTMHGMILTCKPKQIHSVINKSKSEFSLLTFKINSSKKDFYWA